MEGKCTAHRAQSWAGAKVRWGSIKEGLECFRKVLTPPDMEHCTVGPGPERIFCRNQNLGKESSGRHGEVKLTLRLQKPLMPQSQKIPEG